MRLPESGKAGMRVTIMMTSTIANRLGVCSWSLQPATPDQLFQTLETIGIRRVQLALDPLREKPDVLIGPLMIIITASLIILPMWGVDVSSILVPAGVIGLVLGLALQDPLANIFSGISLLIEAPFRTGDLIILNDGRTCEVEKLGLRSTQFYSIEEHSTVFVPNRTLSNSTLVNITQPTVEQKITIDLTIGIKHDLATIETSLRDMANGASVYFGFKYD